MADYTIQISSSLIRRLTDEETKKKRTNKSKPKSSPEQPTKLKDKPKPSPFAPPDAEKIDIPPGEWASKPLFVPVIPLSTLPAATELEAVRSVLQESEKVVEKLEKQEANKVEELTQRAKELREKEFKLPYQKPAPCLSEREACLECYRENLNDPLKCSSVVNKFAHCARQARQHVVSQVEN
ncbi:hypothetical protein AXF42_Ash009384 [Apostasia shenzhenica]|uniref:Coiled-coil-helix-coiled-coil-helix domain-containing protein 3, mitochondrial n=1 Tax=Apostasia shenzhenica TaxID=1088818 RepID=A0A2I0B3Y2_9ASPA|nr:hypothetical protein AXF42_Ash009384 [Apostasia shenzhenica]